MDQDHAGNRPLPDFPLLRFPFRLFFISSALVGAILIPSWLWVWTHGWLGLALEPVSWHQHEMLAGFANAAVAGFLLTAICNWTGTPPLSGRRLLGLWLLWLAITLSLLRVLLRRCGVNPYPFGAIKNLIPRMQVAELGHVPLFFL